MQHQAALRDIDDAAAPPIVADGPVVELIGRWLDLSELERRAFGALMRELTMSSNLVEQSTLDLSDRFQELARIAQAQTGRVDAIIDVAKAVQVNGEAVPLDAAMRSVEEVLLKVIETIVSVSKHAMRMVYALDDVVIDVKGAEQCVSQIDAINTQTRYLALNAAIEANRSGEGGAAFRVIAHEIKELSRATEETSKQVRSRIASITRGVSNGHRVLQEIATLDMSEHILAKAQLDALIRGIMQQNHSFTDVLAEAAESSAEMARTIGKLITGMQFQDRTKQHLGQVIDVLGVLEEATLSLQQMTWTAFPGLFQVGAIEQEWLRRIVEKQTLGAVRERILTRLLNGNAGGDEEAPVVGDDAQGGDDVESGDVELF